jgi:hypothetical protein
MCLVPPQAWSVILLRLTVFVTSQVRSTFLCLAVLKVPYVNVYLKMASHTKRVVRSLLRCLPPLAVPMVLLPKAKPVEGTSNHG